MPKNRSKLQLDSSKWLKRMTIYSLVASGQTLENCFTLTMYDQDTA